MWLACVVCGPMYRGDAPGRGDKGYRWEHIVVRSARFLITVTITVPLPAGWSHVTPTVTPLTTPRHSWRVQLWPTPGFPRKAGMERKDLIAKNCTIFSEQGAAIEQCVDVGLILDRPAQVAA